MLQLEHETQTGPVPDPVTYPRNHVPFAALVCAAMFAGTLLWSPFVWAQRRIDLPVETPLETPRVELDLTDARVSITIDSGRPALFSAHTADPGIDRELFLVGAVTPGAVTRIWRNEGESNLPTIVVEVNLALDQVLIVTGRRLVLDITHVDPDIEPDPAVEPNTPVNEAPVVALDPANPGIEDGIGPVISVDLADSDFRARNLQSLTLIAMRSIVDLEFIGEPLEINLDETEVHARGGRGSTILHAVASDITIEDATGDLLVDLEGGYLAATGGRLKVQGKVSNTGVELVSLLGTIQLSGSDTSIRITDMLDSPIQLAGTDLNIVLDNVGGPIRANLEGGRILADSIGNRLDLHLAAGAEADLRDLRGDLSMVMSDGVWAGVKHVAGHTRIHLDTSDLEITDLKSLELNARGGNITGAEIRNLTSVETIDSTLRITLPSKAGKHEIVLKGTSTASIRLPTPCRVIAKMPDITDGNQLRVSGCLLDFDGTRKRGMHRGIDGQVPIQLKATLDEFATLEVHGLP